LYVQTDWSVCIEENDILQKLCVSFKLIIILFSLV